MTLLFILYKVVKFERLTVGSNLIWIVPWCYKPFWAKGGNVLFFILFAAQTAKQKRCRCRAFIPVIIVCVVLVVIRNHSELVFLWGWCKSSVHIVRLLLIVCSCWPIVCRWIKRMLFCVACGEGLSRPIWQMDRWRCRVVAVISAFGVGWRE